MNLKLDNINIEKNTYTRYCYGRHSSGVRKPFGMEIPNLSGTDEYRYGFNGMRKDDEIKGEGNSYDFGARIYDSRVGRWLSRDPAEAKYPSHSPYIFVINSPLVFVDPNGKDPKVAIILVPEKGTTVNSQGNDAYYDFDQHIASLQAQGYTVVKVTTGQAAIEAMQIYSSPESPTEDLILISHGSPGGMSNMHHSGIYTLSEMKTFIDPVLKERYKTDALNEILNKFQGYVPQDEPGQTEFMNNMEAEVNSYVDNNWNTIKQDVYKKYGVATTVDVGNAIKNGSIETNNLSIVLGGCALGGTVPLDGQVIFAQELSNETNAPVVAASGLSSPVDYSTKRKANSWSLFKPDKAPQKLNGGASTIDMVKAAGAAKKVN